jgi:NEDD8-activating enzyme E1
MQNKPKVTTDLDRILLRPGGFSKEGFPASE